MTIDRSKALIPKKKGFLFEPFRFPKQSIPLDKAKLEPQTELIVLERGGMPALFWRVKWRIIMLPRANWEGINIEYQVVNR